MQEAAGDLRKRFVAAGFEVAEARDRRGGVTVKKYNCFRRFEPDSAGDWQPRGPANFLVRGLSCELEDRGYQKFWLKDGKRFPIRLADLKAFHRFEEEVCAILGVKSLYNQSLGSTCARTVYDRLAGRANR